MLIVTAPLVQAKTTDGTIHQVRENGSLPEGLADGQAEHLLRKGLVVDTEAKGKKGRTAPKKAAAPPPPPPPDPNAGGGQTTAKDPAEGSGSGQ